MQLLLIVLEVEYGKRTNNKKIDSIKDDFELLRNRHVHELDKAPGVPKCSTLADRMQEKFECIVNWYEEQFENKIQGVEREQFDLLVGMLIRLSSEISDLSKKQPDGLVNKFKVGQINRVLRPLKAIMSSEPSSQFLELVAEVEEKSEKSRNSYSDVSVILSQYKEACGRYSALYYNTPWSVRL